MDSRILEGALRAVSVPDLLTFINMIKKTGILSLRHEERVRRVFWERGEMIFASSSDPEEALGNFLLRHGKITQEQNMKSGLMVSPGTRQGKVLVQMGVLTPKELWWAVKNQVLEIIYACFTLEDGVFFFEEMEDAHEEKIKLSTSTTNIIMEGIRRLDEWPRIRELIPNDHLVPMLSPAESRDPGVRFLEGEQAILTLVDGNRSVREIIHLAELDEFETLRVLMSFILARYIAIPELQTSEQNDDLDDASALDGLVVTYNRIFSRIIGTLAGHLDDDGLALFTATAVESSRNDVLDGVRFDEHGCLDIKTLIANVADHHVEERVSVLDGALSNLLSFFLFEASKHLTPEEKNAIYRMAGERSSPASL